MVLLLFLVAFLYSSFNLKCFLLLNSTRDVNIVFWQTGYRLLKTGLKPVFGFTDIQVSQIRRGRLR